MSIRAFLPFACTVLLLLSGRSNAQFTPVHPGTDAMYNASQGPFYHGVASGDPLADAVIIWTRITRTTYEPLLAQWEVALDRDFETIVRSGSTTTDTSADYTVKVDVRGLEPATTYFYRFIHDSSISPVGRTRTSPAADESKPLRFAVISCTSYQWGYFNGLGRIAERDDLDAVLHLGDYIYEHGIGGYGDTSIGRHHLPEHEIVSLRDYRTRYAQYRLDIDFQRAHQMHPFITIWDDHEITNNSYTTGAQNHQPEEGDYSLRKERARKAYYEWLPIRENAEGKLYRSFNFGKTADLFMLDERLEGRTKQLRSIDDPALNSPQQRMLGQEQLEWLLGAMSKSSATWKILGNQVIFSDMDLSEVWEGRTINFDAWDGYPYEKQKIIGHIRGNQIENVIITTGDTHCSWAFEVPVSIADYREDPSRVVAVEFGTPSISSANVNESRDDEVVLSTEDLYMEGRTNPHLKYVNLRDHGYTILSVSPDEASAEWWYTPDIRSRNNQQELGKTVLVKSRTHILRSGN